MASVKKDLSTAMSCGNHTSIQKASASSCATTPIEPMDEVLKARVLRSARLRESFRIKTFPWERLPIGLHEKIFAKVHRLSRPRDWRAMEEHSRYENFGYFTWLYGPVPPLLVALRGLYKSYRQALGWWAKENQELWVVMMDFALGRLQIDFSEMNDIEFAVYCKAARKLRIRIQGDRWMSSLGFGHMLKLPVLFTEQWLSFVNIRDVWIVLCDVYAVDSVPLITEFPFLLEGFKSLSKLTVMIAHAQGGLNNQKRQEILDGHMKRYSKKIGVYPKKVNHPTLGGLKEDVFVWEAPDGHLMDWSQGLGWVWKWPKTPTRNVRQQPEKTPDYNLSQLFEE